jgi:hypothetical protein
MCVRIRNAQVIGSNPIAGSDYLTCPIARARLVCITPLVMPDLTGLDGCSRRKRLIAPWNPGVDMVTSSYGSSATPYRA